MQTSTLDHTELRSLSRRHLLRALPLTAVALDALVLIASVSLAGAARNRGIFFDSLAGVPNLQLLGSIIVLGWVALIAVQGGYQNEIFGAGVDEYKRMISASALTAGAIGIICYLAKYPLSRGFYVVVFAVGVPALLVTRYLLRKVLQRARRRGHLRHRALVVGNVSSIEDVAHVLGRETWMGLEVVGALTPATDLAEETPSGVPVLANSDEAADLAVELGVDVVLFAGGGIASANEMRQLLWELESVNVHVVLAPNMTEISSDRLKIRPVGGLPLVHVGKPRAAEALSWAKRTFDIIGSALLLALFAPLMALVALRIKRHDGGPVLFRQERVGRGGDTFQCFKFRTMVVDAEDRRDALLAEQHHVVTEGMFKMRDDPRITPPGRWIRRYSLDELPQLWNVLRGDMSLVGPRPPLPTEVAAYDVTASRRLRVRPGMTGLWQVSGRSDLSWSETIRLDIYYVDNWSMLQDLIILGRTARAVLRSAGAY
jgi:exopolysaccharide biosynthesis polyprenyl glycosylphosphotransferase